MLLYPSAFNMTTGPLHWELLQRARANDLQLFVATISPARDETAGYVAWGHSTIVDPWGKIVATVEEGEEIVYADIGEYFYIWYVYKMFFFCFPTKYILNIFNEC